MSDKKFERLIKRGILTPDALEKIKRESETSNNHIEDIFMTKGVSKHEILFCLFEYYGYPFVEYSEDVLISQNVLRRLDLERLKHSLWIPLSISHDRAEVITHRPDDTLLIDDIKKTLRVENIDFLIALPSDIIRIIENNQDLNPHFPPSAGRTPLAKVRTFLADRRSLFSCERTSFSKGRTGLAFLRTGVSFITIALLLLRVFNFGYLTILEAALFIAGVVIAIDGLTWYIPSRKTAKRVLDCSSTEPTGGTTVLEVHNPGDFPVFSRSEPVKDADKLRADWSNLSPVMRRRFLAGDRTDFAEERTTLACYRTIMARARTGLAFTRTGIVFIGLGIALIRQFQAGAWTIFDASLLAVGVIMAMEGSYWYFRGRSAGNKGLVSVIKANEEKNIWDFVFPPVHNRLIPQDFYSHMPDVRESYSPGIWATTGLALERTMLAERRNVMARLRTVMARSRTGLAFIRTGMSIASIGMGLLVYFGTGNIAWTAFDIAMALVGLAFIIDGLYWHIPAEKVRRHFPYCFGDMEIPVPDYGKPVRNWKKVVFSHDDN